MCKMSNEKLTSVNEDIKEVSMEKVFWKDREVKEFTESCIFPDGKEMLGWNGNNIPMPVRVYAILEKPITDNEYRVIGRTKMYKHCGEYPPTNKRTLNIKEELDRLNSLHNIDNHRVIIDTNNFIFVLGEVFGIAISKEKNEVNLPYIDDVDVELSGYNCYDLEENDNEWCISKGCVYNSFYIRDKKEVANESLSMLCHNLKYISSTHTFELKNF